MPAPSRKYRSDRNHVIYVVTVETKKYIGLTVMRGRAVGKTLKYRLKAHKTRALTEGKDWKLAKAIRKADDADISITALEIVRGKAAAHIREVTLIHRRKTELNTQRKGWKV